MQFKNDIQDIGANNTIEQVAQNIIGFGYVSYNGGIQITQIL
jgi:hypothetical protein